MNFHKKIGFLAALLLTFGLGVPDGFAQTVEDVELTVSPSKLSEGAPSTVITVTATVKYDSAPNATNPTTVTVNLAKHATSTSPSKDGVDYIVSNANNDNNVTDDVLPAISVVIPAGETSGKGQRLFSFDPIADDDIFEEKYVIQGTEGVANNTDTAAITVTDDIKDFTVSLSKTQFSDQAGATDVVVVGTITLNSPATARDTAVVSVVLPTAPHDPDNPNPNATQPKGYTDDNTHVVSMQTFEIIFDVGDTANSSPQGVLVIDPASDTDDADDEKVRIRFTAAPGKSGSNGESKTYNQDLTLIDEEIGVEDVTLSIKPNSLQETADETIVSVTVNVTLDTYVSTATSLTVTLSNLEETPDAVSDDATVTISTSQVVVNVPANSNKGTKVETITVDPTLDATSSNDGLITIQGSADIDAANTGIAPVTGTATIDIVDTDNRLESLVLEPASFDFDEPKAGSQAKGETVTVKIGLRREVDTATTVTVTVTMSELPADNADNPRTAETGDYAFDSAQDNFVVIIPAGSQNYEGTAGFTFTVNSDADAEDEAVFILGSAVATIVDEVTKTDTVKLNIMDATPAAGLKLSLAPKSLSEEAGATSVTVTAKVTLQTAVTSATNVTVTLTDDTANVAKASKAEDNDYLLGTLPKITVSIASGQKEGTGTGVFTIDPTVDPETDAETVRIKGTATAAGASLSGTASISITDGRVAELDKDADDADGFRVIITTPTTSAKWARVGANQVKVQVHRKHGLASEWGEYTQIKVALHDTVGVYNATDNPDGFPIAAGDATEFRHTQVGEDYTLTVTDGDLQLSNLSLASVRTDTLKNNASSKGLGTSVVAYTRGVRPLGYDVLEFRFNIKNLLSAEKLGPPRQSIVDLYGVYAVVTFYSGSSTVDSATEVGKIESRDTKTTIAPKMSFVTDVVGDGKYIKIDRTKPATDIIKRLTTTYREGSGSHKAVKDQYVGIGDWIKTEFTYDDFDEHNVRLEIFAIEEYKVDDVKVVNANGAMRTYKPVFAGDAILRGYIDIDPEADNRGILRDSVRVATGQFERKYTANDPDKDKNRFKKNGWFEDDNVLVNVRATVTDKAGNASQQAATTGRSETFYLDSKPPVVKIAYPKPTASDSARFTAKISQTYDFLGDDPKSQALKPLKFKVDEPTSSEWVVLGGLKADVDTLTSGASDGLEKVYDISGFALKNTKQGANPEKDNARPSADVPVGGKAVDLTVVVKDLAGNKGAGSPDGVAIFDAKVPVVSKLFPNNTSLDAYGNKIGGSENTQNPVFRINEVTDSILVRYYGRDKRDVVGSTAQLSIVGENIKVSFSGKDSLIQDEVYDLQVYARDLAHHVGVSTVEKGLTYDRYFDNPDAGGFKVATEVRDNTMAKGEQGADAYAKMDSVVAGQPVRLTITAIDTMLTRKSGKTRAAVTYNAAGVQVVAMGSDGTMASAAQVKYWGGGVTDNKDGSATLDDAGWIIGERQIFVAIGGSDTYKLVVKDMTADGVLNFDGEAGMTVDAADFQGLMITATDNGIVGTTNVWGEFDLNVIPIDKYRNPSLKAFLGDTAPKTGGADSLNILDTRIKAANNSHEYDKIYVELEPNYSLEGFSSRGRPIYLKGRTYVLTAPDRRGKTLEFDASVDDQGIEDNDNRTEKVTAFVKFTLEPQTSDSQLALEASETEVAITPGNDSGSATVTASGKFREDSVVAFTVDVTEGSADDVTHSQKGDVLTLTATGDATVSVTATDGVGTAEAVTITFDLQTRVAYSDSDGNPVYLISDSDMTVGTDDFAAFVAAYGSSAGDENYNLQADVDDDGDVDIDDFLKFVSSYGREAQGPATKPLVLLPGINENAEFSLSLGSERVVAGELVAVDVSLANVEALIGYGFVLHYESDKFEFVSAAPASEDLLKSTGGETPLFKHWAADGQVTIANGVVNGTAVSGGGDIVRFTFRVLREFEENARFEVADGLVFDPQQLQNVAVVAGVLELQSTPMEFALHQNFPNPFNPDTTIKYQLAESADVTLQIYNVLGQVVRTLVAAESQVPGRYQIRWNGMDDRGVPVSSGVYFYHLSAEGKFQDVRKLMLLK